MNIISKERDIVLPFALVNGIIIISAEADGEAGHFIFDTGAMQTAVNQKYYPNISMESVEIVRYSEELADASAGKGVLHRAVFDSFSVEELPVVDMNLDYVEAPLSGFLPELRLLGTLGIDVLGRFRILLDYEHGKIVLNPTETICGYQTELTMDELPIIELTSSGKTHQFVLDTGANTCLIGMDVSEDFSLQATDQAGVYTIPRLALKEIQYDNILAVITDMSPVRQKVAADGIIGFQLLNSQRSCLDFENGKLILENR